MVAIGGKHTYTTNGKHRSLMENTDHYSDMSAGKHAYASL